MNEINKKLQVPVSQEVAYLKFANQLNSWWPKEYTWSQENLQKIEIDLRQGGLCTETGPYNFRCDWGRVLEIEKNKKIVLTWQISPQRVPEPNPEKASTVSITFGEMPDIKSTTIVLEHTNFKNHGAGAEDYKKAMDSEYGWDYILNKYSRYCEE